MNPRVTAVMLAYGAEPWLETAVRALLASTGVELDVVLVDNGCTGDGVAQVKGLPGVRVLSPDHNTGYSQKSFNLIAYKGQTIRVYFLGVEDVSLQTSFVIDDTALNVQ